MKGLLVRRPLELIMTPALLVRDFEDMVFEGYMDYGHTSLLTLAELVDDFAVYAESHEQSGNPFALVDDESLDEAVIKDIKADRYYEVVEDVREVLMYHHMFFYEKDYNFLEFYNMPIVEVW